MSRKVRKWLKSRLTRSPGLTAQIVSAHAAHNEVGAGACERIRAVYDTLVNIGEARGSGRKGAAGQSNP